MRGKMAQNKFETIFSFNKLNFDLFVCVVGTTNRGLTEQQSTLTVSPRKPSFSSNIPVHMYCIKWHFR